MKYFSITLTILFALTLHCFAQGKSAPKSEELSEKEFREAIEKAFQERDRQLSKPQIIYYSPVADFAGNRIAYVKRTLDYRLRGGGLIPFLSDSPKVERKSDLLELCQREIATGAEVVLKSWEVPEPDTVNEISYIRVKLDWNKQLLYEIHFSSYNKRIHIEGGSWCYGGGFCITNKRDGEIIKNSVVNKIKVRLDDDPERNRYPTSNKIIIE